MGAFDIRRDDWYRGYRSNKGPYSRVRIYHLPYRYEMQRCHGSCRPLSSICGLDCAQYLLQQSGRL